MPRKTEGPTSRKGIEFSSYEKNADIKIKPGFPPALRKRTICGQRVFSRLYHEKPDPKKSAWPDDGKNDWKCRKTEPGEKTFKGELPFDRGQAERWI